MQSIKEFKTAQNLSDSAFQRLKDRVIAANSGTPQDELIVYGYKGDRNSNMVIDVAAFEKCLAPKRETKRLSASDAAIVPITAEIITVDTSALAAFQPRSITLNGAQGNAIEVLQAKFAQVAALAQSNADLEQSLSARAQSLTDIQRAMQALAEQNAIEQGKQDALRLEALRIQAMESVQLGKLQG